MRADTSTHTNSGANATSAGTADAPQPLSPDAQRALSSASQLGVVNPGLLAAGHVLRLEQAAHPVGLQRLRPWARSALWRDIVWRTDMGNKGMYS